METKQQAACYIRVSTEEQTEYSPEAQRRALEGYARQHGYSIDPAHVYVDAGISGRRAETRPGLHGHDRRSQRKATSLYSHSRP